MESGCPSEQSCESLVCEQCGERFEIIAGQPRRQWCSLVCAYKAIQTRTEVFGSYWAPTADGEAKVVKVISTEDV